jgi:hypothetical protein
LPSINPFPTHFESASCRRRRHVAALAFAFVGTGHPFDRGIFLRPWPPAKRWRIITFAGRDRVTDNEF